MQRLDWDALQAACLVYLSCLAHQQRIASAARHHAWRERVWTRSSVSKCAAAAARCASDCCWAAHWQRTDDMMFPFGPA